MELDPQVLTVRVAEAEDAVVTRLRELAQHPDQSPEKIALYDATASLGVLKRDAKRS